MMAEIDALIEDDVAEQEGIEGGEEQEALWDEWEEEMAEGAAQGDRKRGEESTGDEWARMASEEDQRRETAGTGKRGGELGEEKKGKEPGKRRKTTACAMFEPSAWARMSGVIGKRGETADVTGD